MNGGESRAITGTFPRRSSTEARAIWDFMKGREEISRLTDITEGRDIFRLPRRLKEDAPRAGRV